MPQWFDKTENEIKDYEVDWETWLDGDTISTSSWTIPSGITKNSDSKTTTSATIWVSGGSSGYTYELVNQVETAGGRTEDESIFITVT